MATQAEAQKILQASAFSRQQVEALLKLLASLSRPGGDMVPYIIPPNTRFTVPINKQALFTIPINIEEGASLVLDGALVEVT